MIIIVNAKITDVRLDQNKTRYALNSDIRFDVARYCYASLGALSPLVTKYFFHLDLSDYPGKQDEMQNWLETHIPKEKLEINWYRCNNILQWRELTEKFNGLNDNLIFHAPWEDHIFWDSNLDRISEGLELIKNDPHPNAVLPLSHYPESIRYTSVLPDLEVLDNHNFVTCMRPNNDCFRVMKRELWDWYLDQITDPNHFIFRHEHWNDIQYPMNKMYISTKELFRHYDGYTHVGITAEVEPPLEIPSGFFNGMILRYGFNERDNNAVNINPANTILKAVDSNIGTDYRFSLDDIPLFWKPFIKEIIVNNNADHNKLTDYRNKFYQELANINFFSIGSNFGDHNKIPSVWLENHML